jgi:hypothetical protein
MKGWLVTNELEMVWKEEKHGLVKHSPSHNGET